MIKIATCILIYGLIGLLAVYLNAKRSDSPYEAERDVLTLFFLWPLVLVLFPPIFATIYFVKVLQEFARKSCK